MKRNNGERLRVAVKLAELETKLDTHVCYIRKKFEDHDNTQAKIFEKLDKITEQTAIHKTKIGLIGAIGGFIGSIIVGVIVFLITSACK